jgi:hypothetical protein
MGGLGSRGFALGRRDIRTILVFGLVERSSRGLDDLFGVSRLRIRLVLWERTSS